MSLVQLRVLSSGLFQDWDFRISILPEREEIVICKFRIRPVTSHEVGPRQLGGGERADRIADHNSAMLSNPPELGDGFRSAVCRKVGFASNVARIQISE